MERRWLNRLVIYTALLTTAAFMVLSWDVYRLLKEPMLREGQVPLIIHVERQTSTQQFVTLLKTKGLLRSSKLFRLLIRIQGFSQQLQAGIYQVYPGESAQQFLYRVVRGDVVIEMLRIIEGTTLAQLIPVLEKAAYLNYQASDWKVVTADHQHPEGLLLADSYQYPAGSDASLVLKQAHEHLMRYLDWIWQNRSQGLPYRSSYELLVAASIIEKEASLPEEKKLIAGVMVNRLKKNMPLQMDPTVIYALGENYRGKLSRADLKVDSAYNTYRYRGLPPTPIAMVGKEAIDAAAHPRVTPYLYFVAKGDGSHQFSENYEQQKQAILRYRNKDN